MSDTAPRQIIAKHDGWLDTEPGDTHGEIRVMADRTREVLQRESVPMTARLLCGPGERVTVGDVIAEVDDEDDGDDGGTVVAGPPVLPLTESEKALVARAERQGIPLDDLCRDPWGELWVAGALPLCYAVGDEEVAS